MPRVKIGLALPDREKLDAEIARLRDLDVGQLRSRWHTALAGQRPFTLLVISYFAAWRTGCRRTALGTWTGKVSVCSIGRGGLRGWTERRGFKPTDHRASARHHPGPRMERADAAGGSAYRWLCLEWQDLSEPVEGCLRDHRASAGMDRNSSSTRRAIERGPHHEGRINESGSLRDLYPRLDRPRTRTRLQLARRPV